MFGREQLGQLVHMGFDQLLILEHDPRPALRVGRGPGRLGGQRRIDRFLQGRGGAKPDLRLDFAMRRVPHVAVALCVGDAAAVDEMFDAAHWDSDPLA